MASDFDLDQTDRLLTTTRAVRRRLDLSRPVPREVLLECIEVALQAPSGGNAQGWRWLIVDDADTRRELAALYRAGFDPYIERRRAEGSLDPSDPIPTSATFLADHLHEVPVHVIPCTIGRLPADAPVADVASFYGSILPAVWSFMLALRSRGLGTAWTTLHLTQEQRTAELLGLPDVLTQVALLPVAYTIGDDFQPARRRPATAVTHWNRWGTKTEGA